MRKRKELRQMGLAMECGSGNTRIQIMDDHCSAPDQAERDAAIRRRVYARALATIRADPSRYEAVMAEKAAKGEDEETPG